VVSAGLPRSLVVSLGLQWSLVVSAGLPWSPVVSPGLQGSLLVSLVSFVHNIDLLRRTYRQYFPAADS